MRIADRLGWATLFPPPFLSATAQFTEYPRPVRQAPIALL